MLSEAQIETELGSLLKVDITSSRWAESCLLDLEYVQRMAEQLNIAPSESRYAIGMAILQAINDCMVPNGPHSPLDAWRDVIAAELNFVAAIRKTIVAVLAIRIDSVSARRIVEVFTGDKFSPAKLIAEDLSTAARQQMVAAALRNLLIWKTWAPLDIKDTEEWKKITIALGQDGALTRDIIYESRDHLRRQVAVFLHSNQSPSFSSGFTATWQTEPPTRPSVPPTSQSDNSQPLQQAKQLLPPVHSPERDSESSNDSARTREDRDRFEAANAWMDKLTADGLSRKARQLARIMAALTLEIETGTEPTPRLIRLNVDWALRWIRIEPAETDLGDELIAQLVDKNIVRQAWDTLEFARPDLQYFLAAEYVAQPECNWASLHPRFHTILHWAAKLIAPQQDDYRNKKFFDRLYSAPRVASPWGWLDFADCLTLFLKHRTPIVDKHIANVETLLNELLKDGLIRFRYAIFQRLERLKGETAPGGMDTYPVLIDDQAFEYLRRQYDLQYLLSNLGLSPKEPPDEWLRSRIVLSRLINVFRRTDDLIWQHASAAWLQVAALNTKIGPNSLQNILWGNLLITAREALAQVALDKNVGAPTKELVTKALASNESLLHLYGLAQYLPVIVELEIITGRRLWQRHGSDEWEIINYIQPDPF